MTASPDPRLIQPYLFFNGRCAEAIEFYQRALDAELQIAMRFKDSPEPPPPGCMPAGWDDKIMHASLRLGAVILMLSDGCESSALNFSGFSLSLTVRDEAEAARAFAALAQDGKVEMPLGKTFWSPCFGMVQDKFGVGWMVTVPMPA